MALYPQEPIIESTMIVDSGGANLASVSASGALKTDSSATTQPISGTVTANGNLGNNTDTAGSDTIVALNGTVVATTHGSSAVFFSVTGTWIATIAIEAQGGDSNWISVLGLSGSTSLANSFAANTTIIVPCGGYTQVRLRASAFTSGTVAVTWNASVGVGAVPVFNFNAAALNTTTKIVDSAGSQLASVSSLGALSVVSTSPTKTTYAASAINIATAVAATDVFTLTGSASKTIKVLSVLISGVQTTAGSVSVLLVKRSTANTGGTSSILTNVPLDSTNASATATARSYTANPTLGTTVGTILSRKVGFEAAATASDFEGWGIEAHLEGQPITLRGTGEVLAVNLNGVTVTGGSLSCSFVWTEE